MAANAGSGKCNITRSYIVEQRMRGRISRGWLYADDNKHPSTNKEVLLSRKRKDYMLVLVVRKSKVIHVSGCSIYCSDTANHSDAICAELNACWERAAFQPEPQSRPCRSRRVDIPPHCAPVVEGYTATKPKTKPK